MRRNRKKSNITIAALAKSTILKHQKIICILGASIFLLALYRTVVVDAEPGQPFECHMVDLNNDGRMEILASAFDTR